MATIGLNVQDSPIGGSLSLADTLAKGIFGDPEGQMKARNLASQILAHQAYATKLGADTRLVSEHLTEDQRAEAERLRAGPLIGEAAAAAIPAPIPVEASRANAPGTTGYGPQPGIVSPDEASRVEKLRARERALGPILARSKPEDIGKAVGVDYGGTILAGATANPAIVNPDSLRLASTLYTGSAPTTSTVMTTGDYAGVDAATRGKILEERAKPPPITDYRGQPGIVRYDAQGNPIYTPAQGTAPDPIKPNTTEVNGVQVETTIDPTTGKAVSTPVPGAPVKPPEIKTIESGGVHYQLIPDASGRETAVLIPGQPPTTQKPNTFTGANNETLLAVPDPTAPGGYRAVPMAGAPTPLPPAVAVDPSKPLMTRDAGGLHPIQGMPQAPPEPTGAFGGLNTEGGRMDKLVTEVSQGVLTDPHFQPTQQQAFDYSFSYNKLYEQPHLTEVRDAETGKVDMVSVPPTPPIGVVHPDEVFKRAGLPPQPRPATLPFLRQAQQRRRLRRPLARGASRWRRSRARRRSARRRWRRHRPDGHPRQQEAKSDRRRGQGPRVRASFAKRHRHPRPVFRRRRSQRPDRVVGGAAEQGRSDDLVALGGSFAAKRQGQAIWLGGQPLAVDRTLQALGRRDQRRRVRARHERLRPALRRHPRADRREDPAAA